MSKSSGAKFCVFRGFCVKIGNLPNFFEGAQQGGLLPQTSHPRWIATCRLLFF